MRNRHSIPCLVLAIVLQACSFTVTEQEQGQLDTKFAGAIFRTSDGGRIPYRLFSPAVSAGQKLPLVVYLHGVGSSGNAIPTLEIDAMQFACAASQATNKCFVLQPRSPGVTEFFELVAVQYFLGVEIYRKANQQAAASFSNFDIPVGEFMAGPKKYLTMFVVQHDDPAARGISVFRNVKIFEEGAAASAQPINFNQHAITDYLYPASGFKGGGVVEVSADGLTITVKNMTATGQALSGECGKKIDFLYTVTPRTRMTFEWQAPAGNCGRYHRIGLDNDTTIWQEKWASYDWNVDPPLPYPSISNPMKNTLRLIDSLKTALPIDQTRIYILGYSMGGFGTFDALSRRPELFAGAIPCSGGGSATVASVIKDIPIWVCHGSQDGLVSDQWSEVMVDGLRAAGATPHFTNYPGGHDVFATVLNRNEPGLIDWLFAQKRTVTASVPMSTTRVGSAVHSIHVRNGMLQIQGASPGLTLTLLNAAGTIVGRGVAGAGGAGELGLNPNSGILFLSVGGGPALKLVYR